MAAMAQFHWDPDSYLALMRSEVPQYERYADTALDERVEAERLLESVPEGIGHHIDDVLERAAVGLRARGLEVETQAERVAPGAAGVRCCEKGVDLLVTGSRGYGTLRTVLLGGTWRHIVDHVPCPVLVFPRGVSTTLVSDDAVAALSAA